MSLLMLAATAPCAESPTALVKEHCVKCHNPEKHQADLDLTAIGERPTSLAGRKIWQKVLEQVKNEEMPPEAPLPTAAERRALEEELAKWRVFVQAQRQFADASTQAEILARFLKLAEPFAAGLAVYVSKTDGLALWKSRGNGVFPEIISEGSTDPMS